MSEENNQKNVPAFGAFGMLYKNEDENAVRQFIIDFTALNKQAEVENLSNDTYFGAVYGFKAAVMAIVSNYNLIPKKQPVNAEQVSDELIKMYEEAVAEEEERQAAELAESPKNG